MVAPLVVLCAIEPELAHLRGMLTPGAEDWHARRRAWLTRLGEQPIVMALCGVGMLGAAAAAESVIGRYAPAAVLNYGCVGAHRADLLPGDLILGSRYVHYANVRQAPDGTERWVGPCYQRDGVAGRAGALVADPRLLEAATAAAREWQHEPWPLGVGWPDGVAHRAPRVVVGTVCSGDRWNRAPATIRALAERHDSLCEDMEAAALALTCLSHDVPFLAIKDVSNNELLSATTTGRVVELTQGELARRAAAVTLATLERLGSDR